MIRKAVVADLEHLLPMARAFYDEAKTYQGIVYSEAKTMGMAADLIHGPLGLLCVAEREGKLAGFVAAHRTEPWMSETHVVEEIALYVAPECRGGFIGTRLIAAMVGWADLLKVPYILAGTSTGIEEDSCIALYSHYGFRRRSIALGLWLEHN